MFALRQTARHGEHYLCHLCYLFDSIFCVRSEFSPDHLIYDARVALDDLHHLGAHIFIYIVGYGDAMLTIAVEGDRRVDGLQQRVLVDAGDDETGFVDGLGTLGRSANADGWERMSHTGEEAALLRQGTTVAHHRKGVHLQAVVVMESQRLMLDDALVQLEPTRFETLAAAGVTAVEDGHVILLSHLVDGVEQRQEVLLSVDVLLAVGTQKDVLALLQAQTLVDVRGFDLLQVVMQYLGHGATCHIGTLLGQTTVREVATGMLRISHVHIADDIDDATIGLLGQTFVLATVASLHVEDGDVQTLGADDAEAAVGVAQNQDGIRLDLHHELIALGDDVAHGLAQVVADGVHVDLGVGELQVLEEDTVEVIVIVLAGVGQDAVEILAAFVDDRCESYDLRARADDDQQL